MGKYVRLKIKRSQRWLLFCLVLGLIAARFMSAPPPSSAALMVRTAAGAAPADIQAAVDQFRADLGGQNNGVGGGSLSGRREINWDDVPDNLAAPNSFPADYYNTTSPRGIVLDSGLGPNFQVSADDSNPTSTPARFGNLNPTYPGSFKTFSAQRLFAAPGTFIIHIKFVVPGTNIPATVKGFGAVFTDVDSNTSTLVACRDINGQLLGSAFAQPSNNGLSFVGLSFNQGERIASVDISSGNTIVGADDVDGTNSSSDVVVMDDFIYGEPQPLTNPNYFRWTGSLANDRWSTAQNWLGGIAPIAGNTQNTTLEFPSQFFQDATVPINTNDYGTANSPPTFNSIRFSGVGYNLKSAFSGPSSLGSINLNNITTTNQTGTNTLSMNVAVPGDGSFISGAAGTKLVFLGSLVAVKSSGGKMTLDGAGDFQFNTVATALNPQSTLVKNGSGTLDVAGDFGGGRIDFELRTVLNAGTIVFANPSSTTPVTMTGGLLATLDFESSTQFKNALASVGGISATGGTIAPGGLHGHGILQVGGTSVGIGGPPPPGGFPSLLVGALTLDPATTLDLELNGTDPGGVQGLGIGVTPTQYDRLEVVGPVDLGGATLNLHLNFTPAETDRLTIIENRDDPVVGGGIPFHFTTKGTFKNLPEGAIFPVGGTLFKITYRGGDGNDVVLTGVPKISVDDVTVTEGNAGTTNATFTLSLSSPSDQTITVDFGTLDGTATASSDYGPRSGTRIFNPGQTSETITIPINGDTVGEPDETFFIVLSDPVGAIITRPVGTATIANDDGAPAPLSLSVNNQTITEGDAGTTNAVFTVTLSAASNQTVSVDYLTSDGTADAPSDYQFVSGTLSFSPGQTTRTITVPVRGDTTPEPDETFFVNLMNPTGATISQAQGVGTIKDNDPFGVLQLSQASYNVNEGAGRLDVQVARTGDTSSAASVDFATSDGSAQQKSDYNIAVGTLKFEPGETSKVISIFITDDAYVEGSESFNLTLSNPAGAVLGATTSAVITIADNDATASTSNPVDQAAFFVRQHYVDFLNRDPDLAGYQGWINILNTCPQGDTRCDRIEVSSAFFRSEEFQGRGYFIYRFYSAALGRPPKYQEFMADLRRVTGFLSPQQLEDAKVDFVKDFMGRSEFKTKYDPTLGDAAAYVSLLESTAGVTLANKPALVAGLQSGTETRATVLRKVIESSEVATKFYNEAFVVMQYFGYLRRDPDILYLQWIDTLNRTGDYRVMVNGFMNSLEYRQRFNQ